MSDRPFFPLEEFRDLMSPEYVEDNKIHCIKTIRGITGADLKQAKDFLEQEWLPFTKGEFVNDFRLAPKQVYENVEFDALVEQVQILAEEVNNLKATQTKQNAKRIFNDD